MFMYHVHQILEALFHSEPKRSKLTCITQPKNYQEMLPNFIQNPNDQKLFSPVPKWLKNMYSHAISLENKKGQSMLYCTCIIATMYVKSLRHVFIQNPDKSEGHKNIVTSHRTLTDEKATITSLFLKVYTIKHHRVL